MVAAARHEKPRRGRFHEDWGHDRDVWQVRAAGMGIVGGCDIARNERRECSLDRAHGLSHRAKVHGNMGSVGHEPALLVEHRTRVVKAFLNIRGYRGIPKHSSHLLCDRHEGISQDLKSNRIRAGEIARRRDGAVPSRSCSTSTPSSSISASKPGSMTTVEVASTTKAGPSSGYPPEVLAGEQRGLTAPLPRNSTSTARNGSAGLRRPLQPRIDDRGRRALVCRA